MNDMFHTAGHRTDHGNLFRDSIKTVHAFMIIYSFFFSVILVLVALDPAICATATPDDPAVSSNDILLLNAMLKKEQADLKKLEQEIKTQKKRRDRQLGKLNKNEISEAILDETRIAVESARINIQSAQLDLSQTQQKVQTLQARIAKLQGLAAGAGDRKNAQIGKLQQKLSHMKSILALEQRYARLLAKRMNLLNQESALAESWWESVQAVYQQQQRLRHQESLDSLKQRLRKLEKSARHKTATLKKQLAELKPDDPAFASKQQLLASEIKSINETRNILRARIKFHTLRSRYDNLGIPTLSNALPEKLRSTLAGLRDIREQLGALISIGGAKLRILQQQWALSQKQYALGNLPDALFAKEKKIFTDLIGLQNSLLDTMKAFQDRIDADIKQMETVYARSVQQSLTARQLFPCEVAVWKNMFYDIAALPGKLKLIFTDILKQIAAGWKQSESGRRIMFVMLSMLFIAVAVLLGRLSDSRKLPAALELRLSTKIRVAAFAMLSGSRFVLLFGGVLMLAAWLFRCDQEHFHVLLLFVSLLFGLQLIVKLSYLVFASELLSSAHRQPRLHRMISTAAALAATLVLFMGLADHGLLSPAIKAFIDRLFMLLLLVSVYFLVRLRALLIERLGIGKKQKLWVHILELASLSIPLTAFCAAVVGLAGYINLARFVAWQLFIFLVVIMLWMGVRDLGRDVLQNWKLRLQNRADRLDGLDPSVASSLERLLDLFFFMGAILTLARIYGWNTGNAVDAFLQSWLEYPLFHINGQPVAILNIFISLFLLILFLHLSSLSRHVVYLFMGRNVAGRGLRNSISIFTQYVVFAAGTMIAVNTMGIDLTSLAVFAGALGVGIGFGLQNIANNLISGIILLAERPVRVEDWVSVGDKQGIISRIGMRSLVLTTWDNQDVIIPNADLITNPVTNWTLSDNLIRTVFLVGVRYQDDPHRAREVIFDAVSMVPEVSLQRKPRVYLIEFADSSVNFRVHFYSEIDSQHSRLNVKSKVMFAIWDALKEADIDIPFPQQDIYIKEIPAGNTGAPLQEVEDKGQDEKDGSSPA